MSQENAALGRRWFEQVWNLGNIDAADELASADCKAYGHAPNDQPIGIPQFKEFAAVFAPPFPTSRFTSKKQFPKATAR